MNSIDAAIAGHAGNGIFVFHIGISGFQIKLSDYHFSFMNTEFDSTFLSSVRDEAPFSFCRDVVIFAGLPSSDVIDMLNEQPTYKAGDPSQLYSPPLPTLAEETIDKAIDTDNEFFGPRYTLGLLLPEVEKAHANNIKVISWTLNSKGLIVNYLQNGKFDGMITDYPAYVVYNYYTMY